MSIKDKGKTKRKTRGRSSIDLRDIGTIQIDLRENEVCRQCWGGLEKAISRFENVQFADVSKEGLLTVVTNLAKCKSRDKLAVLLEQLQKQIIHSCKAKNPAGV